MKKIITLLTIVLLCATQLSSAAKDSIYNTNNLRTLFLNNEAVIYALNVRTFNAKDKNNDEIIDLDGGEESGTFINAIENLNAISNLGINTIHLLPITPVGKIKALGTAGSLYAITDFTTINPQLHDKKSKLSLEGQARLFFDECHKRNIRVIVDLPSCGSYELYLKNPDLFLLDRRQQPIIPADWTDVRLFKTLNPDGTLNQELLELHKRFVDMAMSLGADGIRADVAPCKPYEFWEELIKYARKKDPEFLFLAEASNSWTTPVCEAAVYTDYKRLLDAGFDGYYGSYFNYKNWKNVSELKKQVLLDQHLSSKGSEKKSVIGSFATHDELSPILVGKSNFSKTIMWLNATLPLNPYYVDGFTTGDNYMYGYGNKRAAKTYTDDDYYYVHKGKLDIFNFSRAPGGPDTKIINTLFLSLKLREYAKEAITKGNFKTLYSNNSSVFCFTRSFGGKTVIVITNTNLNEKQKCKIRLPGINQNTNIMPIAFTNSPTVTKGTISINLEPAETAVLYLGNFKF